MAMENRALWTLQFITVLIFIITIIIQVMAALLTTAWVTPIKCYQVIWISFPVLVLSSPSGIAFPSSQEHRMISTEPLESLARNHTVTAAETSVTVDEELRLGQNNIHAYQHVHSIGYNNKSLRWIFTALCDALDHLFETYVSIICLCINAAWATNSEDILQQYATLIALRW